jgi:hypothetical protein
LEALLRRAVPADQLAAACIDEWRRTAPAADVTRVTAAQTGTAKNAPAAARYNAALAALKRR